MEIFDVFNNGKTKTHEESTIKRILSMLQVAETEADKRAVIHVMQLEGITPDELRKAISDMNKGEER